METWAPIVGVTMVSIGSVGILVGIGGLVYANWPRSKPGRKAKPTPAEVAGQVGEDRP